MALEFNNTTVCLRVGVVSAREVFTAHVYTVRISMTCSFDRELMRSIINDLLQQRYIPSLEREVSVELYFDWCPTSSFLLLFPFSVARILSCFHSILSEMKGLISVKVEDLKEALFDVWMKMEGSECGIKIKVALKALNGFSLLSTVVCSLGMISLGRSGMVEWQS